VDAEEDDRDDADEAREANEDEEEDRRASATSATTSRLLGPTVTLNLNGVSAEAGGTLLESSLVKRPGARRMKSGDSVRFTFKRLAEVLGVNDVLEAIESEITESEALAEVV
jgi:hypothetical protein